MLQTIVSLEFPALSFIFAPSITFFNREFILVDRSVRIRLTRNHSDVTRLPRAPRACLSPNHQRYKGRGLSLAHRSEHGLDSRKLAARWLLVCFPSFSLNPLLGRQCSRFFWNPGCHFTIEACVDQQTECRLILLA